ncbi:hypothetical protein TEA_019028 [Camellia sinensis var. sinensis]|uniref:S1 motif domain-containing protein n=1 Tax=Camellia sinensis var. sinensis TaxID=542762 RepID=A0A4V3WQA9_CAMSN|nr:hypothetical protein TEA_019028 [Camellia sinensis var. sinensis]
MTLQRDDLFSFSSLMTVTSFFSSLRTLDPLPFLYENPGFEGYVKNITPKGCFIMLSRKLDAKILLSNLSDGYVENLEKEFPIGKLVVGKVASVEPLSKRVEVTLRTSNASKTQKSDINGLNSLHVGDIVSGQIKRIESYGLFITIDHNLFSFSSLMTVTSFFSSLRTLDPLPFLYENPRFEGYVKNITPKGCFIMLSRKLDAKILLSNLSDGYVENLEKEFPIGKLVVGKVASVEPLSKRVEVTLRTSNASKTQKSDINGLNSLHVGDIVSGQIKRIESYGLFITIDHANTSRGESYIKGFEGIQLHVKLCKQYHCCVMIAEWIDNEFSYFMSNYDIQAPSKQKYDDAIEEKDHMVGTQLTMLPDRGSLGMQNLDFECENGQHLLLAEVEARASILPLEVPLDDIEKSDMVNAACQNIEHVDDADAVDQKNKSQAKKKANEEREREIRAAEERLLEKDIPRSADEFEKVVRISPNSSFVWIKYMAFMLSLADVEKARSIAESLRSDQTPSEQSFADHLHIMLETGQFKSRTRIR